MLVEYLQKKKERLQKLKETGDSRYIFQNELDKACFQYYMAFGDFKDLARRAASDKKYCTSILPKVLNMMDIKEVLLQWFINILVKIF